MKTSKLSGLMVAASMLAVLMAGCQKESVTLNARMDRFENDGKVYIDGMTPRWHVGDKLWLNTDKAVIDCHDEFAAIEAPLADAYYSVYPLELVDATSTIDNITLTLPRVQVYRTDDDGYQIVKAPMGAYTTGPYSGGGYNPNDAELVFTNMGSMLHINLKKGADITGDFTVDSVQVISNNNTAALCGPAVVDNITAATRSFHTTGNAADYNTVSLAGKDNTSLGMALTDDDNLVYIYIPAVTNDANRFAVRIYGRDGEDVFHCYEMVQPETGVVGSIARNKIAGITFTAYAEDEIAVAPAGALKGYFSVSDNLKVYISKGNLQAAWNMDGLNWYDLRFAPHQYDIIGTGNNGLTTQNETWFDLFGWGTGGNYNVAQNASTSNSGVYGTFTDWGDSRILDCGNLRAGTWRTMTGGTNGEWDYLMNQRTGTRAATVNGVSNCRYALAKVNSVNGQLVFPDGFVWPSSITLPAGFTCNQMVNNWNNLNLTVEQFAVLEDMGVAFLPAAGYRDGQTFNTWNYEVGKYWSSTASANTTRQEWSWSSFSYVTVVDAYNAYCHCFYKGNTTQGGTNGTGNSDNRAMGFSVRLVRNCNL